MLISAIFLKNMQIVDYELCFFEETMDYFFK